LRFDPRNREEAPDSDVEPVFNGKVEINVFENRIESILTVEL
jgi:hypothetical protein